jgi:hypothetical protein
MHLMPLPTEDFFLHVLGLVLGAPDHEQGSLQIRLSTLIHDNDNKSLQIGQQVKFNLQEPIFLLLASLNFLCFLLCR